MSLSKEQLQFIYEAKEKLKENGEYDVISSVRPTEVVFSTAHVDYDGRPRSIVTIFSLDQITKEGLERFVLSTEQLRTWQDAHAKGA